MSLSLSIKKRLVFEGVHAFYQSESNPGQLFVAKFVNSGSNLGVVIS